MKYQHQRQHNTSDRIESSSSTMSQPPPDLSEKATGGILSTSFRATQAQRLSIVVPIPDQGKAEELNVQKRVAPKIMTPFEARMLQSAEVFHLSSIPLVSSALFHLLLILFTKLKLDSHSSPSQNKISGEEVSSLMRNGLLLGMLGRGFVLLKRRMSGCIRRR